MARPAKKQPAQKFEEPDEGEGWEDAVVDADDKEAAANLRLRDWRDVERFREMKELRSLVDDDYGLEEIFHIPIKPRAEAGIPLRPAKNTLVLPAKVLPKPVPAAKEAPKAAAKGGKAHAPAKPAHKPAHKSAAKKPAKIKAKRR